MSWNVPLLMIGQKLGRDHIYWPTLSPTEAASVLTSFPSGLTSEYKSPQRASCTLKQIQAITSIVKEWSFSGGWAAAGSLGSASSVINNSPTPNKAVFRYEYPAFTRRDCTREPDLIAEFLPKIHGGPAYMSDVANPRRNFGVLSPITVPLERGEGHIRMTHTNSVGPDPDSANRAFMLFLADRRTEFPIVFPDGSPSSGIDIVTFEADVFGPYIIFTDATSTGAGGLFDCRTCFSTFTPNAVLTVNPVVAPPFTVPLLITALSAGTLTSQSCDLTMTATKFYEYSNTLGETIYNGTTGVATGADPNA